MNYKKGDIVSSYLGEWVMIINYCISDDNARVFAICNTHNLFVGNYYGWFHRPATKEEKSRLFNLLLEKGYTWDEENLELINEL